MKAYKHHEEFKS